MVLILYKYVHLKYLEIEFLPSWFISAYAAEYYLVPVSTPTWKGHRSILHGMRENREGRGGEGGTLMQNVLELAVHYFSHQSLSDRKRRDPVSDHE